MTIENFMAWKKEFDEFQAEERRLGKESAIRDLKGKLTGKQLFLRDASLVDSDVKFLEAGAFLDCCFTQCVRNIACSVR